MKKIINRPGKSAIVAEGYNAFILIITPLFIWKYIAAQPQVSVYYSIYNLLLIYIIELFLFTIMRKACASAGITISLVYLLYIADDIVTQLRGTPLTAKDLFSFGTAMSVAQDYLPGLYLEGMIKARTNHYLAYLIIVFISAITIKKLVKYEHSKKIRIWERSVSAAACFTCIVILQSIDLSAWDMTSFWHQSEASTYGSILCFYKECKELKIPKPDGYNKTDIENYLATYQDEKTVSEHNPDIIVIMNEAWTDFSIYPEFHNLHIETMPYIHSAIKNGDLKFGKTYVSVWGGDTANTEWEFLTQNSMINCQGGIPYNQYIHSKTDSLASHLKNLGYSTTAIHPFFPSGYSRNQVYKYMGFDEFISLSYFDERYAGHGFCEYLSEDELEDSPSGMYIRNKISDSWLFQKTIEIYEEKGKDSPVFIFDVTMQNHGAYNYENYTGEIEVTLTENDSDDRQLSQYLSLVLETDKAFEQLVSYYEQTNRDVIILMFGDHQPSMSLSVYNALLGKNIDATESEWSEQDKNTRYIVPYVVWSNFDLDSTVTYEDISTNYLSLMLQDYAGIPMDSKTKYMSALYDLYPVLSKNIIIDSNNNTVNLDDWNAKENIDASLYRNIQYYSMFH